MDSKFLARVGAAVFVGLAFAIALVQLHKEPAVRSNPEPGGAVLARDPLSAQLRACANMGERARFSADCTAAWAEKRRRFFGVDYPEAYSSLDDPAPLRAAQRPAPSPCGGQRGED